MKNYSVVAEIGQCVKELETIMLPHLQRIDPNINSVHYLYGRSEEITARLTEMTKSPQYKTQKYPLICLFQPFTEDIGAKVGIYSQATLSIAICTLTDQNLLTGDRYQKNFYPILYPMYDELLRQICKSRAFAGSYLKSHRKIDYPYWDNGNNKNTFTDRLDCIEIRDLKLNINTKIC